MTAARAGVVVLAVAVAAVGITRNTWAVGGSDSSCYALMAQAFAEGRLQPRNELAAGAPWPRASETFAPGGFLPSRRNADAAVPICAPGFSLLLAPFYALGGADAIFLMSPLAGALLVYGAFALGQALAGPLAGAGGALVVATMPVLAFQIVQPMNDVLVAALWLCIVALAAQPRDYSGGIGALVGVAVLVRPNLAPAAIVVSIWLAARGWRAFTGFAVAAAPAVAVLLMLNAALYGHPLRTGYGSVAELFAWSYLPANLENYGRALWQTQWAFPLVGLLSVIALPASARRTLAVALSVVLAIGAVYLLYRPFPEWWYLRFLLPALAILAVLAVAAVRHVAPHPAVVVIVVAVVVAAQVRTDAMRDAWRVGQLESRFRTAATVARERLPENAVYLTVWESGSVRYHASRDAVLWDSLAPASLDSAVAWLRASGREPFLMIEDWEEPQFRARFASSSVLGQLDWPPRFDIERRVRIYRFSDRDAYFGGTSIPTEFVLSRHR